MYTKRAVLRAFHPLKTQIRSAGSSAAHPYKTPLQEYRRLVENGVLNHDPYQEKLVDSLGALHQALRSYDPPRVKMPSKSPSSRLARRVLGWMRPKQKEALDYPQEQYNHIPKGLYLWGDVGCGKTMLMDLFFSTVPPHLPKTRIHFHQFMQRLHKRSHEIITAHGGNFDPVPNLAAEIAQNSSVLCFDEFQVTDVADAMLLRRLLMSLLAPTHGIVLFATSNREPCDLYINGIQRESFIPVIKLLETRTHVVHLASPIDYRRVARPLSKAHYHPASAGAPGAYFLEPAQQSRADHVAQWARYFSQGGGPSRTNDVINVWGRELVVPISVPEKLAVFSFDELCGQPLAAGDYLALASHYSAFIVTDIPYLSVNVRDKVRRFITFLDAAYNNRCRLATTAADAFENLFVEPEAISADGFSLVEGKQSKKKAIDGEVDEEKFAFARALSRLSEMSSAAWNGGL